MDIPTDAVSAYDGALAELRQAYTAMDNTFRAISDTLGRLHNWPRANADMLIDALPLDWPDAQRLVTAIARYGQAKDEALRAWSAIPHPLRDTMPAPE